MTDFYNKALNYFPADYSTQIIPTGIQNNYVNVQTKNGMLIRKRNSYKVIAQNRDLVTVQPSTTVPAALLNGGTLDFRIEKGVADVIDFAVIKHSFTNSSGAAVVLAPAQMLIQRVEYWLQNGSTLIGTVYGHELYLQNAYLPRNEFENICVPLGLTESYASAATSVADGTSFTLYIPLWSPWMATRIHPSGLEGNILIRVFYQSTALTTVSGGALTCTGCTLQLSSRDQPQALQNEQEKFYRDLRVPTCLSFLNIQRMQQVMSLTASSTYDIVLSGISGVASCMFFTIRPAAITASNCITYTAIDNYDLLDSSGSSLIGYTRKGLNEQLYEYSTCFDNKFRKLINFNVIAFSQDPVSDFVSGSNCGYQPLTTYERLSITMGAGLASASYLIDVIAYVQDELRIINGKGSSMKS